MNVQQIAVNAIDPPLFNSRLEPDGDAETLKQLGLSIKERQLEPIRVVPSGPNRFRLVFGSRRLAAARVIGLETILADIGEGGSEASEIIENGIENLHRKDLSTYEQARFCAKLRDLKMSGAEVAGKLGISKQHVSNLAVCYEQLPETIKESWRKGEPGTDTNFLRSIVTKEVDGKRVAASPDEMIAAYQERVESLAEVTGEEEDDEEEDDDGPDGETAGAPPPSKYTVQKDRYRHLLKCLRAQRAAQVTIDACRYLVGDIEKIRGVDLGKNEKNPTKKTTKGE